MIHQGSVIGTCHSTYIYAFHSCWNLQQSTILANRVALKLKFKTYVFGNRYIRECWTDKCVQLWYITQVHKAVHIKHDSLET